MTTDQACEYGAEQTWDEDHGWQTWQGCVIHGTQWDQADDTCGAESGDDE